MYKKMKNKKILNSLLYNIKAIRSKNGIRQSEIAKKLEVSLRTYQRIENGEVDLKVSTLIRIYDVIDPYRTNLLEKSISEHFSNENSFDNSDSITKEDLPFKDLSTNETAPIIHSHSEINLIKELLGENNYYDLSGYWETNVEEGITYWDPELFVIYRQPTEQPIIFDSLRENIWKDDLEQMDRSLFRLMECNIPFYSVHHVTHDGELKYKVTSRGRKKQVDGNIYIYGYAQAQKIE